MMNGIKLNIKEIIVIIVFVGSISGTYFTMKSNRDIEITKIKADQANLQIQVNKLEKSINEGITQLNKRADEIYILLINAK